MVTQRQKKLAAVIYIYYYLKREKSVKNKVTRKHNKKLKKRSVWVRDWLLKRCTDGAYEKSLREFREVDNQKFLFKNFLRMDEPTFNELLSKISPLIKKNDTVMRKAIPACERLAVTLRFLASGDTFKSLSVVFRIAPNTISLIIPEVCDAIYKTLKDEYLQVTYTYIANKNI